MMTLYNFFEEAKENDYYRGPQGPQGPQGSSIIAVHITWESLKNLRDNSLLTPGQQYRITDYECTTVQENTQSAGHPFDIIVTADSADKLNENARAADRKRELLPWFEHHESDPAERYFYVDSVVIEGLTLYRWVSYEELNAAAWKPNHRPQYLLTEKRDVGIGDVVWGYQVIDDGSYEHNSEYEAGGTLKTIVNVGEGYMPGLDYFANSKLEAWKLKYCLDNDATRFAWADEVNGKGVIYRMIDEFNNDVPYDFKNIQYQTRPGFTYNQGGSNYAFTRNADLDMIIADIQYYGYVGDRTPSSWASNTCWLRDNPATTSSVIYNSSGTALIYGGNILAVSNENYDVYTFSKTKTTLEDFDVSLNGFLYSCYGNTIRPYVVIEANKYQVLNRITFVGWYFQTSYPGLHCSSNTFGNNCSSNTFGYNCSSNTFASGCYANTFAVGFRLNTFGDNCRSNTFGNGCYGNTFGHSCHSNTFGDGCYGNTFGYGCNSNTFGNSCHSNTFGHSCYSNTFGYNCPSNSFGDGCAYNTFGNNCYDTTFGNNCQYLKINNNTGTRKKYISVDSGVQGASSANQFDLYDSAILNKNYQVTFSKDAVGNYIMKWHNTLLTYTGKYKTSNTDNVWKDITPVETYE